MSNFHTPLCDSLGIDVPILSAPMGGVSSPALVAAVSNAGGMGLLPGVSVPPDDLRRQIREIRSATKKPFGVNLLMHTQFRPPTDPTTVSAAVTASAQTSLNRFRERLGIPHSDARPSAAPDFIDAQRDVIFDEQVPVWSIGLGRPSTDEIARAHARGIKVIAMAATLADASQLESLGVDAIVAQGSEAGGHRSTWTKRSSTQEAAIGTLAFLPDAVEALRVPVIAAGGIVDGRSMLAALALGAAAVLMGTRFIATRESDAPAFYKERLLSATADDTLITDVFSGLYARVLRNDFTDGYGASTPVFPPMLQQIALRDIAMAAREAGNPEFYPLYAGQGVGRIRDVPSAAEIVSRTVQQARDTLKALNTIA